MYRRRARQRRPHAGSPQSLRRLGQHFLSDPKILGRIADALDCVPGETIVEVGPGHGALTRELLARGVQVIAIEKDRALAEQLRFQVSGLRCQVVTGDALELDWHELYSRHPTPDTRYRLKVVGNIPYYITSPLIDKALTPPLPERVVFLVQAEVAERLAAKPGGKTYGALSVGVQAVCRVEKLFTVAPGAFRPPPKVRSALVRLTPLARPLVNDVEVAPLRAFVTACFSRRRKQLKNAVPGMTEQDLRAAGFDPTLRPERLSPEAFVRLFRRSLTYQQ
ncbi:MAG: ribosomal RNA small subunit methyltransferase A [Gemmatimonadetes bacterium 13_1_20CM_4_66_11]|nr:MAG: ribosomal RNA small subunit methyltransferase A [Gemmatimonadetes bacterium 13_1_20CM_4_66_11]